MPETIRALVTKDADFSYDELNNSLIDTILHYTDRYIKEFNIPLLERFTKIENPQLLKYRPKIDQEESDQVDYQGLHSDNFNPQSAGRQLSMIFYLNDVDQDGGGETCFPRLGIQIRPKEGRAALFPPFWTHYHEAKPCKAQDKYVLVVWLSYAEEDTKFFW